MEKYVRVCRCGSQIDAATVISLLKSNNFNPRDLMRSSHVEIAGVELDHYVEVPVHEAVQAILVLNDLEVPGVMNEQR